MRLAFLKESRLRVGLITMLLSTATCSDGPTSPSGPVDPDPVGLALETLVGRTAAPGSTHRFGTAAAANAHPIFTVAVAVATPKDSLRVVVTELGETAELGSALVVTEAERTSRTIAVAPSPAPRTLRLHVQNLSGARDVSFTVVADTLSRGPEVAKDTIATWDTVSVESIDAAGDVDEFRYAVNPIHPYQIYLQALVPFPDTLRAEFEIDGQVYGTRSVVATTDSLTEIPVPEFGLPIGGTLRFRVYSGNAPGAGSSTGAYRLWVREVRLPTMLSLLTGGVRTGVIENPYSHWSVGWPLNAAMQLSVIPLPGPATDSIHVVGLSPLNTDTLYALSLAASDSASVLVPLRTVSASPSHHRVLLRGAPGQEFRLRNSTRWGPGPETGSANITPSDTVWRERIEDRFDEDAYVFSAAAGSEVVLTGIVDTTAPPSAYATFTLRTAAGTFITSLTMGPTTQTLGDSLRGAVLSAGGDYKLEVTSNTLESSVPYAFRLRPVDLAPESAPATLTLDATATDAIHDVGDVDRYTLDLAAGDSVVVRFARDSGVVPPITLSVKQGSTTISTQVTSGAQSSLAEFALPPLVAPSTGSYTIEVRAAVGAVSSPVPYELRVERFTQAPEAALPTLSVGQRVTSEALDAIYDVDEFVLLSDSARPVAFVLVLPGGTQPSQVEATLERLPADPEATPLLEDVTVHGDSLSSSTAISLVAGAEYRLRLRLANGGGPRAYALELAPISAQPESLPALLPPGDWSAAEGVDRYADVDAFRIPVDSGLRYAVDVEMLGTSTSGMQFYLAGNPMTVGYSSGSPIVARPSAADTVTLVVRNDTPTEGSYRVRVAVGEDAPETASAALSLGDSVTTESLEHAADEDHFTFAGTAGVAVLVKWLTFGVDDLQEPGVAIFDTDGNRLGFSVATNGAYEFTPPTTGTYRLVVAPSRLDTNADVGAYHLVLRAP